MDIILFNDGIAMLRPIDANFDDLQNASVCSGQTHAMSSVNQNHGRTTTV
ncbi:hypothetical Protein YC6258_00067 [Gynuella sunshinyii YC6258]|uniref:Uncharacterized protein n=1 Tax=Gynuella sunshinyii YC6258 TaxID=1445510 RepID=A0A0C5VFE3_9GAMM|nr:hypothetical Protein YC6258_00067 [Gynuella sunshinyii YC6258]